MTDLYMAVDWETSEPKIFTSYEDLKEFSMNKKYGYNYYKLGEVEELSDYQLGYYSK